MTKICPVCDKEFDTEYVHQIYCSAECKKIAVRERSLKYYYDHLDYCRFKNRKYNQNHKEQLREYAKKYQQVHKEEFLNYQKEYYRKNKERISKYQKDWYQEKKSKTKIAECSKKYNDCFNCPTPNGECMFD